MKAPEKIYLYPSDRAGEEYENEWGDKPWGEGNVEYTRTDIFIKKACDWFRRIDYDDTLPPFETTEEFIKGFKNYMKGE